VKFTAILLFFVHSCSGFYHPRQLSPDSIAIQNASFEMANSFPYSSPGFGVWNNGPIPYWTTNWRSGLMAAGTFGLQLSSEWQQPSPTVTAASFFRLSAFRSSPIQPTHYQSMSATVWTDL